MRQVANKVLGNASAKLREAGFTGRRDLKIVDFEPLEDGRLAGNVLISFSKDTEPPTARQVEAYFTGLFGNKVHANLNTLYRYDQWPVLSVVAHVLVQTRPVTDAENKEAMTMITPGSYMDVASKAIWDVRSDEGGRKFMVRRSDENLSEIIEARRVRLNRNLPRLAMLKQGAVDAQVGDRVQFYDNGIVAYGEVTGRGDGKVTISTKTGPVTVDRMAVFKVVAKGQVEMADEKNLLRNYFERAFGNPEFAKELTETTSKEQAGGLTGA